MRTLTVALNPADRDTLVSRLLADDFTHWARPFQNALGVILDGDDDEHAPRGYVTRLSVSQRIIDFYGGYTGGLGSIRVLNNPWQTDSLAHIPESHRVDAFLAAQTPPLRIPGRFLPAWGTGKSDGSADAQDTTTTRVLLNQWTELIRLVNMGQSGQRFQVKSAGEYELAIRINYDPTGTRFGLQATRNATTVGPELETSDGTARGAIGGSLSVGDLIGVAVRSAQPSTFDVLGGSYIRLRRIG